MTDICVVGAGSIGCYVGGRLAIAGASVRFIGRPRIAAELAEHGLRLSDYRGYTAQSPAGALDYGTTFDAAREARLVLVTVKSDATETVAEALAPILRPDALVISFQNGLRNAARLAARLPAQRVLTGMVPFNVVARGHGAFHQGSEGDLEVAADPALVPFLPLFTAAGLPLRQQADMPAVLWGKLLLNLNNAINALSGLPLKAELSQRSYRRCLALAQRETLAVLAAAGLRPARVTAVPPAWLPRVLDVPDALFRRLANRMLAIDPLARSSMWEDLALGRRTEIDWINGEVVALAREHGSEAPVNRRLIELVRAAEAGGRRDWTGDALLATLRSAR